MYNRVQSYFFLGFLILVLLLVAYIFLPYFGAIILALTFAVLLDPIYSWLEKKFRGKRGLASLATVLLAIIIIVGPMTLIIAQIIKEAQQFYAAYSDGSGASLAASINNFVQTQAQRIYPEAKVDLEQVASQTLGWLTGNLGTIFTSITEVFLTFFLSMLAMYYMLKDSDKFRKALLMLSPLADKYDTEILAKLKKAVNSVIRGSLLIAIIQALLTAVGFAIFGIPNAALWGTITVVAALIPTVGTALVIVPAVIYLLLIGHLPAAVGLAIWGTVAVGLIDNFLGPKFIERGISIHPFLILLSVLGGIGLFGPIGFLAGPLVLSLLFALLDIYQEEFKVYIDQKAP